MAEPEWFTFARIGLVVEADGRVRGTPDEAASIEVVTDLDAVGAHDAIMRALGCSSDA